VVVVVVVVVIGKGGCWWEGGCTLVVMWMVRMIQGKKGCHGRVRRWVSTEVVLGCWIRRTRHHSTVLLLLLLPSRAWFGASEVLVCCHLGEDSGPRFDKRDSTARSAGLSGISVSRISLFIITCFRPDGQARGCDT
jgi:hypothetical protein